MAELPYPSDGALAPAWIGAYLASGVRKSCQNDEIEKLASERSTIYRKCRLEEIKLPLVAGSLKNVPIEESLRDEVAMDVDDDEDGTQKPRRIPDYGIEVDFELLEDEEREVRIVLSVHSALLLTTLEFKGFIS